MEIFKELHKGDINLSSLNHALIVLISKTEGASLVNDFRPISLLNGIFKVIMKVLANRLRTLLPQLIADSQSAFLAGRSALDNVACVQEIIATCHHHSSDGLLIKLDFAKAFDSMSWNFILDMLKARDFGERWIG